MSVFWGRLYEVWLDLSPTVKVMVVSGLIGLIFGIPTSERAMVWYLARQGIQLENCEDDAMKSLLDAANSADVDALPNALNPDKVRELQTCAADALKRPNGTVSFALDEYRRAHKLQSN